MKRPLYLNLYEDIKNQIENGVLKEGARLMSIRQMVFEGNVSRSTVENAYEMLCAKGYVTCVSQSGYYVNSWAKSSKTKEKERQSNEKKPIKYDFTGKTMSQNAFDFTYWRTVMRIVTEEYTDFLRYGDPLGERKLREAICNYLFAGHGAYYNYHNIVIGAGVQSLLHVLCEMFEKEKYTIAFENPGFKKGNRIFRDHGYNIVYIDGDKNGININELYKSGANMLYISPSHSFPTGASLSGEKRQALLKWAKDTDGYIIEDDYDGEFKYSGKPLSTLMRMDKESRVIYLGTFSKLLPPSIRISYAVLPDALAGKYEEISINYNQTSSTVEQLCMAKFIDEGRLSKQVRKLRKLYSRRNNAIIDSFKCLFEDRVNISPNDTGLHLIATLDISYSALKLCEMAYENGVNLIPMSNYKLSEKSDNLAEIYISCASIEEEDIKKGIAILKECVDKLDLSEA